ncbi:MULTISPECIES: MBL fold metallo-hydrolase [Thioalkalivibrio]|uniref:MBL fold metallo-hydrolase n=1 Tax=Thioalkalivibrio halophilus TaxID=252474 RepID=A0A1V3A035_9GAMM|nr:MULTISPECIES: MBL fold metallo-hydrolase [Thioalkalivibrio]OOC10712.1 MBL fold metallo-hydrolase [Thioalkalivibrio halophilus]
MTMNRWLVTGCLSLAMATTAAAGVEIPADSERLSDARTSDLERVDALQPVRVAEDIYAIIGSVENRTYENEALNVNLGFVVTEEGVVLIDSGPSRRFGGLLEEAVSEVTEKPVTHVIGIGAQDHRWLANGYFEEQGAELIALERTVATRLDFADRHMDRLSGVLDDRFEGSEPVVTDAPLEGDRQVLEIGGTEFHLEYWADAHFPGDAVLYLPATDVLFSGDLVYVDRILGIHPWSDPVQWVEALDQLEERAPAAVVPGHGDVADMARVKADTIDYMRYITEGSARHIEDWSSLDEAVNDLADAPQFEHLLHFDQWHRTNVNRTYLFME